MLTSKLCTFSDWQHPDYRSALYDLQEGFTLHRKQWEFAMIFRALRERGMLHRGTPQQGRKGLGFAVGTEPLPSAFCHYGNWIVATDQAPTEQANEAWGEGQLCFGLDALNSRGLCDPGAFAQLCQFRHVDMNVLPDDLGTFDFLWSSCAFEHLGSLEAGIRFVVESADKYLLPGGWAVHTTEFNLTSNEHTVATGGSVYYRQRDIEELATRLEAVGCYLLPVDYDRGNHPCDNWVDTELLHNSNLHLKLQIGEYTLTSILLIIHKPIQPRP